MIKYVFLVLLLLLGGVVWHFYPQLMIANGYAAKKICTCTLANGRDQATAEKQHLYFSVLSFVKNEVDTINQQVKSSFWGLSPQTAQYRPGIGCILLDGNDDYHVAFPDQEVVLANDSLFWPYGSKELIASTKGLDQKALLDAVDDAFDLDGNVDVKRTTAVLVIHNDTLIAEKYAKTFHKDTPQLGWSMTKSFMNTYVGLLVNEKKLDIQQKGLFKEWQNDDRKDITLNDLLHMNTGLDWEENYAKVSDATNMLYKSENIAAIPLSKKIKYPIGTHWYYSSGTSNILSKFLRNHLKDDNHYLTYLKKKSF